MFWQVFLPDCGVYNRLATGLLPGRLAGPARRGPRGPRHPGADGRGPGGATGRHEPA